jgi:hypothetical protein
MFLQLLYVDTEGFESTGRSNSYDDRVFAVATVLSSLLIYNLPETIRGSDVSKLSFVVELAAGFYDQGNKVLAGHQRPATGIAPYDSAAVQYMLLKYTDMTLSLRLCSPATPTATFTIGNLQCRRTEHAKVSTDQHAGINPPAATAGQAVRWLLSGLSAG